MTVPTISGRFFSPNQQQFFDGSSVEYPGGKLYFYATGSSTPQNTYQQADLDPMSVNPNPVILDSAGRAGNIFMSRLLYKVALYDADDNLIWTADPVSGAANLADIFALYTEIDDLTDDFTTAIASLQAQITSLLNFVNTIGTPTTSVVGSTKTLYATFPGGLTIQAGAFGNDGSANPVTVPFPISFATALYGVTATPFDAKVFVVLSGSSVSHFDYSSFDDAGSLLPCAVGWVAVGR